MQRLMVPGTRNTSFVVAKIKVVVPWPYEVMAREMPALRYLTSRTYLVTNVYESRRRLYALQCYSLFWYAEKIIHLLRSRASRHGIPKRLMLFSLPKMLRTSNATMSYRMLSQYISNVFAIDIQEVCCHCAPNLMKMNSPRSLRCKCPH